VLYARMTGSDQKIFIVIVDIWLRSENIRRSSLSYTPTPPGSIELRRSSALAARTKINDSSDRAF
jgi:hypothetical protein